MPASKTQVNKYCHQIEMEEMMEEMEEMCFFFFFLQVSESCSYVFMQSLRKRRTLTCSGGVYRQVSDLTISH